MRVLSTLGPALAGLALLAPAALAGPPAGRDASGDPAKAKGNSGHLCANCQRSMLKTARGINVPPPPPLPAGAVVHSAACSRCGAATKVVAGKMPPMPSRVAEAPGRAVVGGPPPGVYVASGNDPVPIGMVAPRTAQARPAAPAGSRDASVMPTSMAADPVKPPGHNNPRIVSHLLGLDALGKERAERRERREREGHASIPYGAASQPVTELPSSMVYGRR